MKHPEFYQFPEVVMSFQLDKHQIFGDTENKSVSKVSPTFGIGIDFDEVT